MPLYKLKRCLFSMGDTYAIQRNDNDEVILVVKQNYPRSMLDLGISELEKQRTVLLPGIDGSGFAKMTFCDPTMTTNRIVVRPKYASRRPIFEFERNGVAFATLSQEWTFTMNPWCCYFGSKHFELTFRDGSSPIDIRGELMDLTLRREKREIALVSKSHFSLSDEYGLDVKSEDLQALQQQVDDELLIATVVVVGTVLSSLSSRKRTAFEDVKGDAGCFCC